MHNLHSQMRTARTRSACKLRAGSQTAGLWHCLCFGHSLPLCCDADSQSLSDHPDHLHNRCHGYLGITVNCMRGSTETKRAEGCADGHDYACLAIQDDLPKKQGSGQARLQAIPSAPTCAHWCRHPVCWKASSLLEACLSTSVTRQ